MKITRKQIMPLLLMTAMTIVFILFSGGEPVHADEKTIGSVSVECKPGIWYIEPEINGNYNYSRLYPYVSLSGEGIKDFHFVNLVTKGSDGDFWGVGNEPIDPEKRHYLCVGATVDDGYVWLDGKTLTAKNYSITYHDMNNQEISPVEPGNYYVRLTGKGIYDNQVHVPFTIIKANPMKVSVKAVKIKYKKLKKKAQTITPGKAIKVSNAKGAVSFKLDSARKGSKKIKLSKAKKCFRISANNGQIKVKKKLKKGSYILKINVTAAGDKDYGPMNKTVTLKIKIK